MAGINIGIIREIKLDNGLAKVYLTISAAIPVTRETTAEIRANGILGDRYVELVTGKSSAEELKDGDAIEKVHNAGSLDQVMNKVSNVTESLNEIAVALRDATTGNGSTLSPLGRIVNNIEVITSDVRDFTQQNGKKLTKIVDNLHDTTETINGLVNDDSDEGFKTAWASAVASLKRIDHSLQNIEEVTEKINSGKGTIGQLINDDQTITEINTAVAGVNQMLGTANKIQTNLDFHSEFLARDSLYKTYLGVRIQPGLDRYYEVAVVDDPKGTVETTQTDTTAGGTTSTVTEKKTYKNKVKFTALFAKNFYDFTVKGGLMENSGGVGIDYYFWRRRFRLSTEIFDVRTTGAHLKSSLRWNVIRGVYMVGGMDDYTDAKTSTGYIGAGLDLNNDDLKALLGKFSF
jgi:phospholipid/cholesterol/gamma-HCH transport system substrate-binding protein